MAFPVCSLSLNLLKFFFKYIPYSEALYVDSLGGHKCWTDMCEAWMGATSTTARVSSVAPIGNVCIVIPYNSLYVHDQPECICGISLIFYRRRYPMLEHIQKYLWPRLCKLDQRTL